MAAARVVDGRYLAFHLHPDVFCVLAAIAVFYWYATNRMGPATRRQKVWFYASVATLLVFAEWPIHDLAEHYSYAIHMLEHEVFTMVAAPTMLLGTPDWLLRWAVVGRPWYRLVRFCCRPFAAGIIWSVVLLLSHWPAVVDETTHNEPFHFAAHLVLFLSALVFWMPIINRIPELPRITRPAKLLYLFLTSIPSTLPTIMLIYAAPGLYSAYNGGPQYLGWSMTADQDMAGVIMGVAVTLMIWVLAAYHFFAWYAEESAADQVPRLERLPSDLTWADVERELGARRD